MNSVSIVWVLAVLGMFLPLCHCRFPSRLRGQKRNNDAPKGTPVNEPATAMHPGRLLMGNKEAKKKGKKGKKDDKKANPSPNAAPEMGASRYPSFAPNDQAGIGGSQHATPLDACDPDASFMLFSGHDEVNSMTCGKVNITWSPAFVFHLEHQSLVWCGDLIYDVFVARGVFNFTGFSGWELLQLASQDDNVQHYQTQATNLFLEDYIGGVVYTILVTARTGTGIFSFNRYPAQVTISTMYPTLKANFTRWINLPHPNDRFDIEDIDGANIVVFRGDIPQAVYDLERDDYMYAFLSNGNTIFARCLELVPWFGNDAVAWLYDPADIEDVFDELDVSVDLADTTGDNLDDDDMDDMIDFDPDIEDEIDLLLESLDVHIRIQFCKIAYPDREPFDCYLNDPEEEAPGVVVANGDQSNRRLRCCRRLRRAVKKVVDTAKKVVKKVADTAKKVVEVVKDVLDAEVTASRSLTLLDVDKGAKMSCASDLLEVGMNFDASARAQFHITISILKLVKSSSIRFFGGIGAKAYLFMQSSEEKIFTADPITLFEKSKDHVVFIGPVPLLITNRPSVRAFAAVSMNVEAQMLLPLSVGWDYEFGFTYDQTKREKFTSIARFDRRPPPEEDPAFRLRLAANAEVGISLSWDVLLFRLLQATIAVDLGFGTEIGVGTHLEAMVVTRPLFYTLDKLDLDFFLRVRASLGLNGKIGNVIQDLGIGNEASDESCSFQLVPYRVPLDQKNSNDDGLPQVFERAIDFVVNDDSVDAASIESIDDLLTKAGLFDTFTGGTSALSSPQLDFGLNFELFREDFPIFGLPTIHLVAGSSGICQGNDALVLTIRSEVQRTTNNVLGGIRDGEWFANLDGLVMEEDTPWNMDTNREDANRVTVRLPRSALALPGVSFFEIPAGGRVILRATPELLPFPPKSLFAQGDLSILFHNIQPFECCEDADCAVKFPNGIGGSNGTLCDTNGFCQPSNEETN